MNYDQEIKMCLLEEMYVDPIHRRYLKENRLNRLDNDHDLLENYHPK
jgi:hypothetical protein